MSGRKSKKGEGSPTKNKGEKEDSADEQKAGGRRRRNAAQKDKSPRKKAKLSRKQDKRKDNNDDSRTRNSQFRENSLDSDQEQNMPVELPVQKVQAEAGTVQKEDEVIVDVVEDNDNVITMQVDASEFPSDNEDEQPKSTDEESDEGQILDEEAFEDAGVAM